MKNSLFTASILLGLSFSTPNITFADLRNEYQSQANKSWENAQFERDVANEGYTRIYVDKIGNFYYTQDGTNWTKSKWQVGYISTERNNTCYFGVTAACLNNIIETQTQIAIEKNELVKYTKVGEGTTKRVVLATRR